MSKSLKYWLCAVLATVLAGSVTRADDATQAAEAVPSPTELSIQKAGAAGQYTFLVFYRGADPASRALAEVVQQCATAHPDQAVIAHVQVTNPAEQALVAKYGVARAPLPMVISVGPNGAMTGVFPKSATPEELANAFVAPTMLQCMKHLQEGKLVFVSVHATPEPQVPTGVQQFATTPEFADRTVFVSLPLENSTDTVLMQQMQIDPAQVTGTTTALIAPPGVLVGHFNARSTAAQVGQAVHKAGQCCNDPNCKHNH